MVNEILSALLDGAILGVQFGAVICAFIIAVGIFCFLLSLFITTCNFFLKDKPSQETYKAKLRNSTGVRGVFKNESEKEQ